MKARPAAAAALAALLVLVAGVAPAGATNDPLASKQWGLVSVGAAQAWTTSTGKSVTIGVVDTGADLLHEDLAAKITASTSCIGASGSPAACQGTGQDDEGHGTRVAGVAAAVTGNGKGIAGMAPDAKLVVAKAIDNGGRVSVGDVVAAMQWAVAHGARVINLSLGDSALVLTNVTGASLQSEIEDAWSKGAITVLASGNSAALGFAGGYGNVDAVVVGAVGRDGTVAGYSQPTGTAKWAVVAPGGSNDGTPADDIISTTWVAGQHNAYGTDSGTDMAAPLVSGTLAMLVAAGLSPAQAVARLLAKVNTGVNCGPSSTNCHGMLNAAAALAGLPAPSPSTTLSPTTTVARGTTVPPSPSTTIARPADTIPKPPVMSAGRPSTPPSTVARSATAAGASTPTVHAPAVALSSPNHPGSGGGSIAWFVVLAALFALAGGAGAIWFIRTNADPDPL